MYSCFENNAKKRQFIFRLFYEIVFSCAGYTASTGKVITNNELERILKEMDIAFFKVLSHFRGGTE
jgi:hypothetical protein